MDPPAIAHPPTMKSDSDLDSLDAERTFRLRSDGFSVASMHHAFTCSDPAVYCFLPPRTYTFEILMEGVPKPILFSYVTCDDLASEVEALIKREDLAMVWYAVISSHVEGVLRAEQPSCYATHPGRQWYMTITEMNRDLPTLTPGSSGSADWTEEQTAELASAGTTGSAALTGESGAKTNHDPISTTSGWAPLEHQSIGGIGACPIRSFAASSFMTLTCSINFRNNRLGGGHLEFDKLLTNSTTSRIQPDIVFAILKEAIVACHTTAAEILHGSSSTCTCGEDERSQSGAFSLATRRWLAQRLSSPGQFTPTAPDSSAMVRLLYQHLQGWVSMWESPEADLMLCAMAASFRSQRAIHCLMASLDATSRGKSDVVGPWAWENLFCGYDGSDPFQDPPDIKDISIHSDSLDNASIVENAEPMPTPADSDVTDAQPTTRRTSPRAKVNKVLHYNQKRHPQDEELGFHKRRHSGNDSDPKRVCTDIL